MKALKWIGIAAAAVVIGIVGFAAYLGLFSTPVVTESEMGPYTYAYEEFTGDYKKTGPVFDRVHQAVTAAGVATTRGIGIYFDDPAKVPAEKLRSYCGTIIEDADAARLPELEKTLKVGTIPRGPSLVVEMQVKNPLIYMVGPMKAYPAIGKYLQEKGYKPTDASYEVYDMPAKKIYYVMQIEKQ